MSCVRKCTPLMTSPPSDPFRHAAHLLVAAQTVCPQVLSGEKIARSILNSAMEVTFSAKNINGMWNQRDGFIALEMATILALQRDRLSNEQITALKALEHLSRQLPTQTVRSDDQIALQHFSTPPGLAWLASTLAEIGDQDHILEPSAGKGMLSA